MMKKYRIVSALLLLCLLAALLPAMATEAEAANQVYVTESDVESMVSVSETSYTSSIIASTYTGYTKDNCDRFLTYCINNSTLASKGINGAAGYYYSTVQKLMQNNAGELYISCGAVQQGHEQTYYDWWRNNSGAGRDNVFIANASNFDGPKRGDIALMGWTAGGGDHVVIMASPITCIYASGNTLYQTTKTSSNALVYKNGKDDSDGYLNYFDYIFAYFRFNTEPNAGIPTVTDVNVDGDNVTVRWTRTEYATGYDVYLRHAPWGVEDVSYSYHHDGSNPTGSGNALTYQWYYRDTGAAEWTLWANKTKSVLSFNAIASRNGREVYCVVTAANGKSAASNTATLHIG